ncbi:MAG: hypothetical protein GC145_06165 [Caulobacter sp.]|nr:hypothetical protein [Caulobacter sp.]
MSGRQVDWTDEMDAALLAGRREEPAQGWKKLVLNWPGVTVDQAKARLRLLTGGSPEPGPRRDGLEWLKDKKRLTGDRYVQALRFRRAYRDGGGISIKSSADVGVGGGSPGPRHFEGAMTSHTQAQRDLFHMRWVVLRGQADMVIVMDAVCGLGWTLRDLAGGDWKRAGELEVALKVALDLLHADENGVDIKAA